MEPRESVSNSESGRNSDESSNSAVHVAVRVRPLSGGESAQGSEPCVSILGDASVLVGGLNGKQFDFDAAFAPDIPQHQVYDSLVASLVDRFFDGYNATVFAYGQTGSGKTFTMGNEFKLSVAQADRGIIPRTMDEIFQRIANAPKDTNYVVKVSYLEILNEEIHDLLAAGTTASLSVRDDGKRGITVNGLSEHSVDCLDHVASLLHTGALSRATAATTMNAQSSRSHAICTLTMEQHETTSTQTKFAKFHLVDLAGSERAKRTNAEGARFKEGVNINKGLLSLGNVINALAEKSAHVPYRDSKLTRLLQDSLGGNSKTLMIACISPADVNFEETCNTLRYAARARNIQNQAVVNQTLSAESQVSYLKQQLALLQLQLLQQNTNQQNNSVNQQNNQQNNGLTSFDVGILEKEIDRWRSIATTREEELQLVMSAKDKWKKIADQFMNKKQQHTKGGGAARVMNGGAAAGGRGAGGAGTELYSPKSNALLQDAIEFDKSVCVTIFPTTPVKKPATANGGEENNEENNETTWETDLDHLEDVIKEKEKIVAALSQAAPSSSRDAPHGPLAALSKGYESKIQLLEAQVATLVQEKKRLLANEMASGGSSSSSPQKRVHSNLQLVQSQLQVARHAERECKRLSQLWKSGTLKISTLEKEIGEMKSQKTSLQRKLKEESETHRKDRKDQNLKILQLKRQEQRKQYELHKLTTLHAKQNGVLKRKNEEIAAVNKRMRSMVQTQQSAQQMRSNSKQNRPTGAAAAATQESDALAIAEVTKALATAMDVQLTITGAKNAIRMELEDRKKLALAIAKLEKNQEETAQLEQLKTALKEKNSDIRLLQQKLASVEKNTTSLPSSTVLLPAKLSVCHQLIRQLMDTVLESKTAAVEMENCKSDLTAAEEQLVEQAQRHEDVVASYKQQLRKFGCSGGGTGSIEKENGSASTSGAADEDELEAVKKELQQVRAELEAARQSVVVKKPKKNSLVAQEKLVELLSSSEDEDDEDEEEEDDDSDYIEDEERSAARGAMRRKKKPTISGGRSRVRQPLQARALVTPAGAGVNTGRVDPMDEIDLLLSKPSVLAGGSGSRCCSCNGKCATKSCACRAEKQSCGPACSCNASKCHNRGDLSMVGTTKAAQKKHKESEVESFFDLTDKENNLPPQPQPQPQPEEESQEKAAVPPHQHESKFKKLWSSGSSSAGNNTMVQRPLSSSSLSSNHKKTAIARFF